MPSAHRQKQGRRADRRGPNEPLFQLTCVTAPLSLCKVWLFYFLPSFCIEVIKVPS